SDVLYYADRRIFNYLSLFQNEGVRSVRHSGFTVPSRIRQSVLNRRSAADSGAAEQLPGYSRYYCYLVLWYTVHERSCRIDYLHYSYSCRLNFMARTLAGSSYDSDFDCCNVYGDNSIHAEYYRIQ